jgi:hypothetical protein
MVHHLFTRTQPKPEFPERADLPRFTDDEAYRALTELRYLVDTDRADVYTQPFHEPKQRPRWNVWLGHQLVPGGQRLELDEWAASFLASPNGGDAA